MARTDKTGPAARLIRDKEAPAARDRKIGKPLACAVVNARPRADEASKPIEPRRNSRMTVADLSIETTPLGILDAQKRLFNAVLKGPTTKPGRFGFRGDIALKFQVQVADEARPPEYSIEQVLAITEDGKSVFPVLVGYIHSFEYLKDLREVLGDMLTPDGIYLLFCDNIDFLAKYDVTIDGVTFHVLPLDESTVWKETLELLSIDKNDIKKLDTAGKLDYVLDAAAEFSQNFKPISFEEGVAAMEPVRNRNANRPV